MTHQPSPALKQLAELALRAGAEVMSVYGKDFAASAKKDSTPVTEADRAVRTSREACLRSCEVEQMSAFIHDCDGRASTVFPGIFRGSIADRLCAFQRKRMLQGDVTCVRVFVGEAERDSGDE